MKMSLSILISINDIEVRLKIYVHIDMLILESLESAHIHDVVKRDFLFLQKIYFASKRKVKCGLKVILLGVNHTIYEPS